MASLFLYNRTTRACRKGRVPPKTPLRNKITPYIITVPSDGALLERAGCRTGLGRACLSAVTRAPTPRQADFAFAFGHLRQMRRSPVITTHQL